MKNQKGVPRSHI